VNLKVHHFERIVTKLRLTTRNTGDRHAWFEHDGRIVTRTKRSLGAGDLPADLIRQQLKLNEDQLKRLVGCSLDRDGYIGILREKGLLG
jgi:hypothetical protein